MSALHELSMTEAADAVARGEVTATALTEGCLARIAAHDGKVNSVIRLDRDSALEQAAAVDAARKAGSLLLTGSANLSLMGTVAESLAGRAIYLELPPFCPAEWSGEAVTATGLDALFAAKFSAADWP